MAIFPRKSQRLVPMTAELATERKPLVGTKLFMDVVNFNNFIRSSKLPESMQDICDTLSKPNLLSNMLAILCIRSLSTVTKDAPSRLYVFKFWTVIPPAFQRKPPTGYN
ncbi:hypothetical protein C5167_025845 [Papaver somniferum]|uniref:Uncharacterized protein n=1 Tax=Papaver somniferum TaxID=3469 RepID=A0A4Y7JVM1_PAPSO|nr:hypothetical protein C5167_025845 [Papaver somniferum]